jgi:transcriptional regulator
VEFLALGALARGGRMHGFQILRWIEETTDGDFLLEEGALYPALHRMEKRAWLEADWATSEKGRRAKYYTVTARGQEALARERRQWQRYVSAVGRVVTGEEAG